MIGFDRPVPVGGRPALRLRIVPGLDRLWSVLYASVILAGAIFLLAPVAVILLVSLSSAPSIVFPPPGFTLAQYTQIPREIYHAFEISLWLGCVVVAIDLAISVPAAFALVRGRIPVRPAFEAVLRSPMQIPGIVLAVGFFLYYSKLLSATGISLRNDFTGLVIAHVVMTAPYMLTAVTVRLASINRHFEHASYGLGAGFARTMWRIVIPYLKPALVSGSFISFVVSFEDVPVALFLSPGASSTTLPVEMFNLAVDSLSPVLFAAMILVLVFSFVLVVVLERLVGIRRVVSGM